MNGSLKFVLMLLLAGSNPGKAAESAASREQDAHVHGHGIINIAIDGKDVFIELESPAVNLLGFEHNPVNADQVTTLEQVQGQLQQYQTIIEFSSGNCRQVAIESEMPAFSESEDAAHEHEGDEAHAEFHMKYQLECSGSEIDRVNVTAFMNFPGFQEINIQWIKGLKQGGTETDPANAYVQF